jgi:hypothetical protein
MQRSPPVHWAFVVHPLVQLPIFPLHVSMPLVDCPAHFVFEGTQLAESPVPFPVQLDAGAHWLALLMHCPLAHWESDVHRHPVLVALQVPTAHE